MEPHLLRSGHRYGCRVTVTNGAGSSTVHDSEGVVMDDSPPQVSRLQLIGAQLHDGFALVHENNSLSVQVAATDHESNVRWLWVSVGTTRGASDVSSRRRYPRSDVVRLTSLSLEISNRSADPFPRYHVTVQAENSAGLQSPPFFSAPILVLRTDSPGVVTDGPGADTDAQTNSGLVTATFHGFHSSHGLARVEAAVGTAPGSDDVEGFAAACVVNLSDDRSRGAVHLHTDLRPGRKHFVNVRVLTRAGNVLSASSNGFVVRRKPLETRIRIISPVSDGRPVIYVRQQPKAEFEIFPRKDEAGPLTIRSSNGRSPWTEDAMTDEPGVANYKNVRVQDDIGVTNSRHDFVIVRDFTPPNLDSIRCNRFVKKRHWVSCRLLGLADMESPVVRVQVALVLHRSSAAASVLSREEAGPLSSVTFTLTADDRRRLSASFFARATVTNAGGWTTERFSEEISRDLTNLRPGPVVLLGDSRRLQWPENDTRTDRAARKCQTAIDAVSVAWPPFRMPGVKLLGYEVAVGTGSGGSDLRGWTSVDPSRSSITLRDLDLRRVKQVFASLRVLTDFGSETSHSAPISISRLGMDSTAPTSLFVDASRNTREISEPLTLSVDLNLTAEPCPLDKLEWAISRLDGKEIMPFSATNGSTRLQYFGIVSKDGDTFIVKLRATSGVHLTFVRRSASLVVRRQSIQGGVVFDGGIVGHDFDFQTGLDSVNASWSGFRPPEADLSTSANFDPTARPRIDYYEVAVGTKNANDDMAPFRPVGLTSRTTIRGLKLAPNTTYFVVVRARSRWLKSALRRSDGIRTRSTVPVTARPVTVKWSPQRRELVNATWEHFQSSVAMKMYFVGVRKENKTMDLSCADQISMLNNPSLLNQYFDASPLVPIFNRLNDSISLIHVDHGENYSVEVIGVNIAGECATSRQTFQVDLTPPASGFVNLNNLNMFAGFYFTRITKALSGTFGNFTDSQSSVTVFNVSLLEGVSDNCLAEAWRIAPLTTGGRATVVLERTKAEFEFDNLALEPHRMYAVEVIAQNKHGLTSRARSAGILVEDTQIAKGTLKVGQPDAEFERHLFLPPMNGVPYSFAHKTGRESDNVNVSTESTSWNTLMTTGMALVSDYPWYIVHEAALVSFGPGRLSLGLRRIVGREGVAAAAVSRSAAFHDEARFRFRLKAAPGPFAVTAFVVWAGPLATPVVRPQDVEEEDVHCRCCLVEQELRINCSCACPTVEAKVIIPPTTTTPAANGWSISSSENLILGHACGVQVYRASEKDILHAWCHDNSSLRVSQKTERLRFDAAAVWQLYEVSFDLTASGDRAMRVFVNDTLLIDLTGGVPKFASQVTTVFHVFNQWKQLPQEKEVATATAEVSDVQFPDPHRNVLKVGKPFTVSRPTSLTYEARLVMVEENSTDSGPAIFNWTKVAQPCVPCIKSSPCSARFCSPDCRENVTVLSAAFPSVSDTDSGQVQVRATTIGGLSVTASSQSVMFDSTPPIQEAEYSIEYYSLDRRHPVEATHIQSSNDTISFRFSIIDPESGIRRFSWALGTRPSQSDVLNFTDIDTKLWVNQTGLSLSDNTTYFVSILAVNKAGLEALITDNRGVRVSSQPPNVSDVQTTVPGSRSLNGQTNVTEKSDCVSVRWTPPADETAKKVEWCVGSREEEEEDVVECTLYERSPNSSNRTGGVDIQDGRATNAASGQSYNVNDTLRSQPVTTHSGTHLEPGKTLHHRVRMCNEAEKCASLPPAKVQVAPPGIQTLSSGTAVLPEKVESRRRRRRSAGIDVRYEVRKSPGESSELTLLLGAVNDTSFFVDTSSKYRPYIVDPQKTGDQTSRLLTDRIVRFVGAGIFVTTAGQTELSGPLIVTVVATPSLSILPHDSELRLLYWNTNKRRWRIADQTCTPPLRREEGTRVVSHVCGTQTDGGYFRLETQFVAAVVRRSPGNRAPQVDPVPPLVLSNTERPLSAKLTLRAVDKDGDRIQWFLLPPPPALGSASVNRETGEVTYMPRIGAVGEDRIRVVARDDPASAGIPSKETKVEFSARLSASVNRPLLLPFVDGREVAVRTDKEEMWANVDVVGSGCGAPSRLHLVGVDMDADDNIDFSFADPPGSDFSMTGKTAAGDFHRTDNVLPNPAHRYSTKLTVSLLFPTAAGHHQLKVVGRDSQGHLSPALRLRIGITTAPRCSPPDQVIVDGEIQTASTEKPEEPQQEEEKSSSIASIVAPVVVILLSASVPVAAIYLYKYFKRKNPTSVSPSPSYEMLKSRGSVDSVWSTGNESVRTMETTIEEAPASRQDSVDSSEPNRLLTDVHC